MPPPLDRDAADVAPSTKQGKQRTWQAVGQAGTFVSITAHEGRPRVNSVSVRRKRIAGSTVAGLAALLLAATTATATSAATGASIVRFGGADRFATSAAIAQANYQPGVNAVYIATGLNFPDALVGGAAAATQYGGPLLLVQPNSIPTQIAAELTRLKPASIFVLGGTAAVSNAVQTTLKTYTPDVYRVAGADRYETAANLTATYPKHLPVFIATGTTYPDALAGTAAATARHAPILLTTSTTLPPVTAAALSALEPSSITILGGTAAVSAAVETQLRAYASTVTRISGPDRYATAAAIAEKVFPGPTSVFITTGAGFADGLTGGPVAGTARQPLLLATTTCLPAATAAVVAADTPATVTLLGGTDALGAGVESLTTCPVPVTTPTEPVTNVVATPASSSIALSWTNPASRVGGVTIRRALGATPPASATAGDLITDTAYPTTSFIDTALTAETQYSYALFAHDTTLGYATAATVTSSTTIATPGNSMYAWGYNEWGQLGDGTTFNRFTPTQVGTDTHWASVAAGVSNTAAIKTDGTMWLSGGLPDVVAYVGSAPVQVGTDTHWASMAVGNGQAVAVKTDGTLWAWGWNGSGQLGDGTTTTRLAPVQVGTDTHWASVDAGFAYTAALKTDGTLWAWGANGSGQLGDGTTTTRLAPVQVGTDTHWASFDTGDDHTAAVKTDGTLWAWGSNASGQLGDGTTLDRLAPVQVGTGTGWASVSAGGWHTVAVKTDGTLWAWGSNTYGQLGDGTTLDRLAPVQVGTGTGWASVSAGWLYTVAVKTDGTLWAWGSNGDGQLGCGGSQANRLTPVQVGTDTGWASVLAGRDETIALRK